MSGPPLAPKAPLIADKAALRSVASQLWAAFGAADRDGMSAEQAAATRKLARFLTHPHIPESARGIAAEADLLRVVARMRRVIAWLREHGAREVEADTRHELAILLWEHQHRLAGAPLREAARLRQEAMRLDRRLRRPLPVAKGHHLLGLLYRTLAHGGRARDEGHALRHFEAARAAFLPERPDLAAESLFSSIRLHACRREGEAEDNAAAARRFRDAALPLFAIRGETDRQTATEIELARGLFEARPEHATVLGEVVDRLTGVLVRLGELPEPAAGIAAEVRRRQTVETLSLLGEAHRHRPARARGAAQADECFRAAVTLLLGPDDPGFAAAHWLRIAEFVTEQAFAGRAPWTSARTVAARACAAAEATTSRAMRLAAAFWEGVVLAETGEPEAALARFERVTAERLDRLGTVDDPFGIAQRAAVASGLAAAGALCALRVRGPLAAVRVFERARVRLRHAAVPAVEVDADLLALVCPPGGALVWLFASRGRAAAVIGCRAADGFQLTALDLDRLGGVCLHAARNRWLAAIQAARDPDADPARRRARMARALKRLLAELGPALAQPLDAHLRGLGLGPEAEIVLVSSGAASLLPLHAAPLADGQPFIARYALRAVPFAGLLAGGAPASRPDPEAWSVILADPSGLGPGGVREADRLVGLFRQAGLRVPRVIDTPAGPRTLARALAGARRVHVTAHGAFGFGDPLRSRLALDGQSVLATHLLAGESLRDCGLVVLASCESALADAGRGDDLLTGLAASVLDLGASTVVGALWPMADGPAATLVAAFYRHHLGGAAPARALRTAMLGVRAAFPHPLDWAPFLAHGR